ncbi:hypothetical protein ACG7TL_001741 [Trametes sanguinea]
MRAHVVRGCGQTRFDGVHEGMDRSPCTRDDRRKHRASSKRLGKELGTRIAYAPSQNDTLRGVVDARGRGQGTSSGRDEDEPMFLAIAEPSARIGEE